MLDLRLAVPAVGAWLSGAVAIALPNGWWFACSLWAVAVAAGGAAAATRMAESRAVRAVDSTGRRRPWASVAAAVCVAAAAAGLVAAAVAVAMPARYPHAVVLLDHHTVEVRAEVTSLAQPAAGGGGGVRFAATVTTLRAGSRSHTMRMPVLIFADAGIRVRIGQAVATSGSLSVLPSSDQVSARLYTSARPRVVAEPSRLLSAVDGIRESFSTGARALPGDGGALLPGLAIGDVHELPTSLSDDMKQSSLTHLTAVSGANCAVVVSLVGIGAGAIGVGRGIRAAASLAALGCFVVLVTPQPSVLRAAVMAAVIVFGGWSGRPGRAVPALALAIIVLLVVDPWLALSFGFVLSVLATGALLLLAPPMTERLARWMPHRLAMIIAVPVSAQVACQPVLILLNPAVPLYGVAANLAAEPAAPVATVLGLASCLVIPWWPAAGGLLAQLAWVPSAWIAAVARVSSALPASSLGPVDGPLGFLLVLVLTVSIVMIVMRPVRRLARLFRLGAIAAATAFVVCTLAGVAGARVAGSLDRPQRWSVAACDIGQGDAVLLQSGQAHALIDTGPDPARLSACLDDLGISRIDLLVLTHYDMDHVGGTAAVLGKVSVAMVGPPADERGRRIGDSLRKAGADVHVAQTGDSGRLGDASWRVLWPDAEPHGMEPGNERSVTMLFNTDGVRSLFLGDLDERAQTALLNTGRVPEVDVVKVAHHGSRDQAEPLYRHIGAAVALISVGAANDYGHPTATALGILSRAGATVMRTDDEGILMLSSDGDGGLVTWSQRHASEAELAEPGRARGSG